MDVTLPDNCPVIRTFDQLINEIAYSIDEDHPCLIKSDDGLFRLNKLTIGPYWIEYKGNYEKLADGLYDKLIIFHATWEKFRD